MSDYQSLLGLSNIDTDVIQADTIVVQKDLTVFGNSTLLGLTIPTGASLNKVLTSDSQGNATWQTQQEQVLAGDAVGPATSNRIDTLAGGTLPVASLVTLTGAQTLTNKVLGSTLVRGSSSQLQLYPTTDNSETSISFKTTIAGGTG
jgi:hypothetical protein